MPTRFRDTQISESVSTLRFWGPPRKSQPTPWSRSKHSDLAAGSPQQPEQQSPVLPASASRSFLEDLKDVADAIDFSDGISQEGLKSPQGQGTWEGNASSESPSMLESLNFHSVKSHLLYGALQAWLPTDFSESSLLGMGSNRLLTQLDQESNRGHSIPPKTYKLRDPRSSPPKQHGNSGSTR